MKARKVQEVMDEIFENRHKIPIDNSELALTTREKQYKEDEAKREYLEYFRVYPGMYIDSRRVLTRFPDNKHIYMTDAFKAMDLLMDKNKDLPFDLRLRLLYYRLQMEDFWEQ